MLQRKPRRKLKRRLSVSVPNMTNRTKQVLSNQPVQNESSHHHRPETSEVPQKKTRVRQCTSETIDTNVCCTCFRTYDDVLEGTGANWIACACGRWLHEDCAEDCVQDDSGNDRFCPLCIELLTA